MSDEIMQLHTPSVHGAFYDEQFKQYHKEALAHQKEYDENSVKKARQALYDAQDDLEQVLKSGDKQAPIHEYRQKVADAKAVLDDALVHAGPLAARKRADEFEAEREKQREKNEREHQAAHAKEQEAEAKAEMRTRYLAAGGTSEQFERAWPALWEQELARRVQTNTYEARLRARYQHI
jgi:hypothetical protein